MRAMFSSLSRDARNCTQAAVRLSTVSKLPRAVRAVVLLE
jgi:hypothetical protein